MGSVYYNTIRSYGSLIRYWRLDEASGNFIDKVASDPAVVHSVTAYQTAGALPEDTDKAAQFGTTYTDAQYAEAADSSALDLNYPCSIELWIKPTADAPVDGDCFALGKGNPTSGTQQAYGIQYVYSVPDSKNYVCARFGDGTGVWGGATYSFVDLNIWQHIVVTYDGTTVKIYLNGVFQHSEVPSGAPRAVQNRSEVLAIASMPGTSRYFPGHIDEVALYTAVLTAGQVLANYDAASTPLPDGDGRIFEPSVFHPKTFGL